MSKPAEDDVVRTPDASFALSNVYAGPVVQGRRDFLVTRELGVAQASGGRMRAQAMSKVPDKPALTGWHYHTCESQLCYVVRGSIDLEFEDGVKRTMREGDCFYIPGGMKHNETTISEDYVYLKVSTPGQLGTVPCEAPPGWK